MEDADGGCGAAVALPLADHDFSVSGRAGGRWCCRGESAAAAGHRPLLLPLLLLLLLLLLLPHGCLMLLLDGVRAVIHRFSLRVVCGCSLADHERLASRWRLARQLVEFRHTSTHC